MLRPGVGMRHGSLKRSMQSARQPFQANGTRGILLPPISTVVEREISPLRLRSTNGRFLQVRFWNPCQRHCCGERNQHIIDQSQVNVNRYARYLTFRVLEPMPLSTFRHQNKSASDDS